MKKKIIITIILTLIIILICPITKTKPKVSADEEVEDTEYSEITVEVENEIVQINNEIHLMYQIELPDTNYNITVESTTFTVIKRIVETTTGFDVYIMNNHLAGEYEFEVIVEDGSEEELINHPGYIYSNGTVDCVSLSCIEESRSIYFVNYELTEEEKELFEEEDPDSTEEYYDIRRRHQKFANKKNDILCEATKETTTENNIQVTGVINWLDENNNPHPLIGNYVYLYGINGPVSKRITLKTNEAGEFSYVINSSDFPGNRKLSIYIGITPMTDTANVTNVTKEYQYISTRINNVSLTEKVNYEITIKSKESNRAASYQISQSMNYVKKYIKELSDMTEEEINEKLPKVKVYYPAIGTGCYYNETFSYIAIDERAYNSWDPCMHEYGHYVDDMFNLTYLPGGNHYNGEKLLKKYGKEKGTRFLYSEAMATYLGISAQLYYNLNSENIPGVGNYDYDSYYGFSNELLNSAFGELYENATIGLLLTLADDVDGRFYDKIALGYKNLWKIMKNKKHQNVSELLTDVLNNDSDNYLKTNIGPLLEHFGFSPKLPYSSKSLSTSKTNNTFSWQTNNLSNGYLILDKFSLVFYSEAFNESYRIDNITTTNYRLTTQDLNEIFKLRSDTLYWQVEGYNTSSPETGPYPSRMLEILKPLNGEITLDTDYNLSLGSGERLWYKFTAPYGGTYEFYTTGTGNTYGELFTSMVTNDTTETNRIAIDDDSGESNNFKISYALTEGQTIYIRIKEFNLNNIQNFTFKIICTNHQHSYKYKAIDNTYHSCTCSCGETSRQRHIIQGGSGILAVGKTATCAYCKALIRIDDGGFYPIIMGNKIIYMTFSKGKDILEELEEM